MENPQIAAVSLRDGVVKDVGVRGSNPLGVIHNHLVYLDPRGDLVAIRFDRRALRATGEPFVVARGVLTEPNNRINAAMASDGSLVYASGQRAYLLALWTEQGFQPLKAPDGVYSYPRFSPDGRRIAVGYATAGANDIWVYDLANATLRRLTTDGTDQRPEWSHDGSRVLFRSGRDTLGSIWVQALAAGPAQRLVGIPQRDIWEAVLAPDDETLLLRTGTLAGADIWMRRLHGDTTLHALGPTAFSEQSPRISPNGKYIAYTSTETGTAEIYVAPFPGMTPRQQVTSEGGMDPLWAPDGRSLYYTNDAVVMRADLNFTGDITVSRRTRLPITDVALATGHPPFDVAPDGRRFVFVRTLTKNIRTVVARDWWVDALANASGAR